MLSPEEKYLFLYPSRHNCTIYITDDIKEENGEYEYTLSPSFHIEDMKSIKTIDFISIHLLSLISLLQVLEKISILIIEHKPLLKINTNNAIYDISIQDIHSYLYNLNAIMFDNLDKNVTYFYLPNDSYIERHNIFCFWTGNNELTPNRIKCLKTIPNYTLITTKNINDYILNSHPLHEAYQYLSETHKADYLRTYFMHFYGGGYSDIKIHTECWDTSFKNVLNNKDIYCCGYTESELGVANDNYRKYWRDLIGNGCYIFRPNTEFTKKWYETMLSILDKKLDFLRKNPSSNPQDCIEFFPRSKYPIQWNEILGRIFHPICYEFKDKILYSLPKICTDNYR